MKPVATFGALKAICDPSGLTLKSKTPDGSEVIWRALVGSPGRAIQIFCGLPVAG